MALTPFDGMNARGRQSQDPFGMMDAMMADMMMPFGGMGMGAGSRGGFFGGGLFEQMDQMMAMGGQGGMMQMSGAGGGPGGFSSQVMCFSSSMGADGQMRTEQYSSSTIGDRTRGIHETQQAYSNSASGVDKMSMERQMGDRGRKVVKERTRGSGEERQTEMFRGMTEDQADEFDGHWREQAAPHLPQHARFQHAALGYGGGGSSSDAYSGGYSRGTDAYGGGAARPRAITAGPSVGEARLPEPRLPEYQHRASAPAVQAAGRSAYPSTSYAAGAAQPRRATTSYQAAPQQYGQYPGAANVPSNHRRSPYY